MFRKARLLFGMFLVTLADIGTGLMVAHILIKLFHPAIPNIFIPLGFLAPLLYLEPPSIPNVQHAVTFYTVGVFAALVPDLDTFLKNSNGRKLHRPFLFLPFVIILWFLADAFWMLLVSIPILLHLLHDSTCGQVGRQWLWPFSKNNYQFFVRTPEGFRFAHAYYRHQWNRVQNLGVEEWLNELYLTFPPSKKFIFELLWFWFAILLLVWWQ